MEYLHIIEIKGKKEDVVPFMKSKGYTLRVTIRGLSYDYIFVKNGFKDGVELSKAQDAIAKAQSLSKVKYTFH